MVFNSEYDCVVKISSQILLDVPMRCLLLILSYRFKKNVTSKQLRLLQGMMNLLQNTSYLNIKRIKLTLSPFDIIYGPQIY